MRRVLALLCALAASGCGYSLVGRGSFLPDNIKVVSFPTFKNSTQRVGLEQRLSRAVATELASRGKFSVTAREGEGDAQLVGDITGFSLYPVSADTLGRATQYQIQITANVALTTLPEGKVIWRNGAYTFRENYDLAVGSVNASNFSDLENVVIDSEAARFAQSLVTSMLEGF
jgi:outer membrane lipopolysaccharide assembly protein LptE/RlpB